VPFKLIYEQLFNVRNYIEMRKLSNNRRELLILRLGRFDVDDDPAEFRQAYAQEAFELNGQLVRLTMGRWAHGRVNETDRPLPS